jgi:hypothetical protein
MTAPETKQYTGTKTVLARPMTRGDYNAYRGWEVPADENPADEGYLVEYVDGGKANHPAHAGYISWSPADVFARAYTENKPDDTSELQAMVDRFLAWPVPADVYPDGTPGKPGRTGTNLLSAPQAEAMLRHVLGARQPG